TAPPPSLSQTGADLTESFRYLTLDPSTPRHRNAVREIFHRVEQPSALDYSNADDVHLRIQQVRAMHRRAHPLLLQLRRILSSPRQIFSDRFEVSTCPRRPRNHILLAGILMFELSRLRQHALCMDACR